MQQPPATARVDALDVPTIAEEETWRVTSGLTVDTDGLGERGMAFEHLDQLALEHLYGVGVMWERTRTCE